jgi:hypothetical protein
MRPRTFLVSCSNLRTQDLERPHASLPLAPGFFSILIALFLGLLVIMVVLGAWRQRVR